MATKTTSVVFKQHDPQSVADLSGVAGGPPWQKCEPQTQKMIDFGETSCENRGTEYSVMAEISVPSKIFDLRKKMNIFNF